MDTRGAERLKMVDSTTLTPLARKALNLVDAVVDDWKYETLRGGSPNSEIYRFSGSAHSGENIFPWSLILKIIRASEGTVDPASLRNWKREALAYQSGLLDDLPVGFCAPRCFGIVEQSDFEDWLWLEEVNDEIRANWSPEHYGRVAHQLGQFNGVFLKERRLPTQPWLTKGWLRAWVANAIPLIPISAEVLAHPLCSRLYPHDIYQRLLQVWHEHDAWLSFIEHQPQTLAHMDAFRRNLLTRRDSIGDMQIVLIDWAFLGSAALGEEIAPLVAASLFFLEFDPDQADTLDKIVFESYLEGLGKTGWQGDPRAVRFTYTASAVLRYSIGVLGITSMLADENRHAGIEQAIGHPLDEVVDVWTKSTRFLYKLADEARGIFNSLH